MDGGPPVWQQWTKGKKVKKGEWRNRQLKRYFDYRPKHISKPARVLEWILDKNIHPICLVLEDKSWHLEKESFQGKKEVKIFFLGNEDN